MHSYERQHSFHLPSCPLGVSWFPLNGLFVKFCIGVGLQKSVEKIQVCLKSDKNNRHSTFRSAFIDDFISTYLSAIQLDRKRGQLKKHTKCFTWPHFTSIQSQHFLPQRPIRYKESFYHWHEILYYVL